MARSMVVVRFSITTSSDVLAKSSPATATVRKRRHDVQYDQVGLHEDKVSVLPKATKHFFVVLKPRFRWQVLGYTLVEYL